MHKLNRHNRQGVQTKTERTLFKTKQYCDIQQRDMPRAIFTSMPRHFVTTPFRQKSSEQRACRAVHEESEAGGHLVLAGCSNTNKVEGVDWGQALAPGKGHVCLCNLR